MIHVGEWYQWGSHPNDACIVVERIAHNAVRVYFWDEEFWKHPPMATPTWRLTPLPTH